MQGLSIERIDMACGIAHDESDTARVAVDWR
jgi:hypothetical protein